MGTLARLDPAGLVSKYRLDVFIETGTGDGTGIREACNLPFRSLVSCDIVEDLATKAGRYFEGDPRVTVYNGTSIDILTQVLPRFHADKILFWLDAHFPGNTIGLPYDAESDMAIRCPLLDELELILSSRSSDCGDVIICDDLRMYEDGPFEGGNLGCRDFLVGTTIKQIESLVARRYLIHRSYHDEGYLLLLPRT